MSLIIKQQLKTLPSKPGVYQFFDVHKKLLYVGKAKNLKNRVKSYFTNTKNLSPAKQKMVEQIDHLQLNQVNNETEALLLEANLIKQHLPPYNVVLKDDKSWLYVAINYQENYPTVSLTRQHDQKKFWYYGPFSSASSIRSSFNLFKKIFGLKTCSNSSSKPCFAARLGRCLGHGQTTADQKYYLQQLEFFKSAIKNGSTKLMQKIETDMKQASAKEQFEKAIRLRDQWLALKKLRAKQIIITPKNDNLDVWGLGENNSGSVICFLPVRNGAILDIQYFWLENTSKLNSADKVENFLEQYYPQATEPAKTIITDFKINIPEGKKLIKPTRGYKKKLLTLANKNANNYLEQSLASWQKKNSTASTGLIELQRILNLPNLPNRIEGYDISNIQGQQAVGSMVVLKNGLPEPKSYRKFQIKGLNSPNDFAMLAQMLVRRFTNNHDWPIPDLIMLDGGLGQLNTVHKVLKSYNLKYPLIALAKKQELIFTTKNNQPIALSQDNTGLRLLQILRDEAHRFGITYYRQKHRAKNIKSAWDELPGIGPKYKKILKQEFGSLKELQKTNQARLTKILGASRTQKLLEHLKR